MKLQSHNSWELRALLLPFQPSLPPTEQPSAPSFLLWHHTPDTLIPGYFTHFLPHHILGMEKRNHTSVCASIKQVQKTTLH